MINKIKDNEYLLNSSILDNGNTIDFITLSELKELVNSLYSEEQNRLLQESLSGDYVCDGCLI
ncbi:hypothetical protein phiL_0401 [Escherichia phage LAMP]|uniref:Uncharacterized protein n=1 Tax=Escherichia phage LAMP TaxID=2065191 RepID=A0A2I6PD11_9CAUD|nr:hypothetical protein phiL_0401 [Escherichia phage LAMP]